MSELPWTDDLPRSDDGFDPARVEEAFVLVRGARPRARVGRGRVAQRARERCGPSAAPTSAPARYDDEDWPADARFAGPARPPSPTWVASVPPPLLRPFAVPRIALEGVFLLAVALLAGLADLERCGSCS